MTPEPDSSGDSASKRKRLGGIIGRLYNHQRLMSADYFAGEVRWLISELEAAHEALNEFEKELKRHADDAYPFDIDHVHHYVLSALNGWEK